MGQIKKVHKLEDAITRYSLNTSNQEYIQTLTEHLKTSHPLIFLRIQLLTLDSSQTKLPASRYSNIYWRIRGYSEEEARQKVSNSQSKNGSFKEKRKKWAKEGLLENEIEEKIREIAIRRGKINSDSHKRAQEKDPTYIRSMSHHCPEFWIKKGYSEDEARIKAAEVCGKNRKKFREKLDSGEIEKGWNNTTIEYYLKKGMTINEAKQAIVDRQKTFTLEKCILKYGEEIGREKWKVRQEKWKAAVFNDLQWIGGGKSKISMDLFEKLEVSDALMGKTERFMRENSIVFKYDFCIKSSKKIIEFNGDYWHCNPNTYSSDFFHTIKKMSAQEIWAYDKKKEDLARSKGYDYLTIWESEYKLFPEETINKCKQFLNGNN